MDRHEEIADQRDQRDGQFDIGTEPDADHDQHGRKAVAAMIEEIAIARPFDPAEPCKAAIKRIAEPVHDIAGDRQPQPIFVDIAGQVTGEDHEGTEHAYGRQNVGSDPAGQYRTEPVQNAPLSPGDKVFLNALDRGIRCLWNWIHRLHFRLWA